MTCDEKYAYRNRKTAANRAAMVRKTLDEPVYAYHCVHCHCWHIGHPRGWRRQQQRLVSAVGLGPPVPVQSTNHPVDGSASTASDLGRI